MSRRRSALDLLVAQDVGDFRVPADVDLGVVDGALLHDLGAAELLAAVEHDDLGREPGQEAGLFERRVAAADDGHLLAAEEEAVTRRTGAHAAAAQARFVVEPQPQRGRAGGDDDRFGRVLHALRPQPERTSREIDHVDVRVDHPRPEPLRLLAELLHQLGALDALREAGVVLDVAGDHQLAAGGVAADDDGLEVGPRGVDRSGQSGRAGADDDDVAVVVRLRLAASRCRPTSAGSPTASAVSLATAVVAPLSSTMLMLGKNGLVGSIGSHRSIAGYSGGVFLGWSTCAVHEPGRMACFCLVRSRDSDCVRAG